MLFVNYNYNFKHQVTRRMHIIYQVLSYIFLPLSYYYYWGLTVGCNFMKKVEAILIWCSSQCNIFRNSVLENPNNGVSVFFSLVIKSKIPFMCITIRILWTAILNSLWNCTHVDLQHYKICSINWLIIHFHKCYFNSKSAAAERPIQHFFFF